MKRCLVSIVVGCKPCPAFSVCPLKWIIGDQPKPDLSIDGPTRYKRGAR